MLGVTVCGNRRCCFASLFLGELGLVEDFLARSFWRDFLHRGCRRVNYAVQSREKDCDFALQRFDCAFSFIPAAALGVLSLFASLNAIFQRPFRPLREFFACEIICSTRLP